MATKSFKMDVDRVRAYAKLIYAASDAVDDINADTILQGGAVACTGTTLKSGLGDRAIEQRDAVKAIRDDLEGFGDEILNAVDAFVRLDGGDCSTAPPSTTDRT